jgi:hypothetical protein
MASSFLPLRPNADAAPIPDEEHEADLPLTMSASVVLTSLPRDAHAALAAAGTFEKEKGKHRRRSKSTLQPRSHSKIPVSSPSSVSSLLTAQSLNVLTSVTTSNCAFQSRRRRTRPAPADLQNQLDAAV